MSELLPKIWISELCFNDGTKVEINQDDLVILVGANNSGKSATLKEINSLIKMKGNKTKVLESVSFLKTEEIFP